MLIGISGKMRSGKDTTAQILKSRLGNALIVGFGDPLYQICAALDGVEIYDKEQGWLPQAMQASERFATAYRFLTRIEERGVRISDRMGTANEIVLIANKTPTSENIVMKNRSRLRNIAEYLRTKDKDVWVKLLQHQLIHNRDWEMNHIIISDVRQHNEISLIEQWHGVTFRVDVSPETQKQRILARGEDYILSDINHIKEQVLDSYSNFTYRLDNDGSYEDLHRQIQEIQFDHTKTGIATIRY